jgi:hypothetical protein
MSISEPQKKVANKDGFQNILSTEVLEELVKLVEITSKDVSYADISIAIQNSKELMSDILKDSSYSMQTKLAMALISCTTQSSARMKMLFKKLPESTFKNYLSPIMPHIQQSGRNYLHTPAHYASAFPGLALYGKLLMVAKIILSERSSMIAPDDEKTGSWTVENSLESGFTTLPKFPLCIMFSTFGAILMESEVQIFHEFWYKWFYTDVVVGAKYSENWYSLISADMHPYYEPVLEVTELKIMRLTMKQVAKTKLTFGVIWGMLENLCSYLSDSKFDLGKMPENTWESLM